MNQSHTCKDVQITIITVVQCCFGPKVASEAISEHLICKIFLREYTPRPTPISNVFRHHCLLTGKLLQPGREQGLGQKDWGFTEIQQWHLHLLPSQSTLNEPTLQPQQKLAAFFINFLYVASVRNYLGIMGRQIYTLYAKAVLIKIWIVYLILIPYFLFKPCSLHNFSLYMYACVCVRYTSEPHKTCSVAMSVLS